MISTVIGVDIVFVLFASSHAEAFPNTAYVELPNGWNFFFFLFIFFIFNSTSSCFFIVFFSKDFYLLACLTCSIVGQLQNIPVTHCILAYLHITCDHASPASAY